MYHFGRNFVLEVNVMSNVEMFSLTVPQKYLGLLCVFINRANDRGNTSTNETRSFKSLN